MRELVNLDRLPVRVLNGITRTIPHGQVRPRAFPRGAIWTITRPRTAEGRRAAGRRGYGGQRCSQARCRERGGCGEFARAAELDISVVGLAACSPLICVAGGSVP